MGLPIPNLNLTSAASASTGDTGAKYFTGGSNTGTIVFADKNLVYKIALLLFGGYYLYKKVLK